MLYVPLTQMLNAFGSNSDLGKVQEMQSLIPVNETQSGLHRMHHNNLQLQHLNKSTQKC